jgi:hypothetical protein
MGAYTASGPCCGFRSCSAPVNTCVFGRSPVTLGMKSHPMWHFCFTLGQLCKDWMVLKRWAVFLTGQCHDVTCTHAVSGCLVGCACFV